MLNEKDVETYVGSLWGFKKEKGVLYKVVKIDLNNKEFLFSEENTFHFTNFTNEEDDEVNTLQGNKINKYMFLRSLEVKSSLTKEESQGIADFLDKLFYDNALDIVLKNGDKEGFKKLTGGV